MTLASKFIRKCSTLYTIGGGKMGPSHQKAVIQQDDIGRKLNKQCCIKGTQDISSTDQAPRGLRTDNHSLIQWKSWFSASEATAPRKGLVPGHYQLCQTYSWFWRMSCVPCPYIRASGESFQGPGPRLFLALPGMFLVLGTMFLFHTSEPQRKHWISPFIPQ